MVGVAARDEMPYKRWKEVSLRKGDYVEVGREVVWVCVWRGLCACMSSGGRRRERDRQTDIQAGRQAGRQTEMSTSPMLALGS